MYFSNNYNTMASCYWTLIPTGESTRGSHNLEVVQLSYKYLNL